MIIWHVVILAFLAGMTIVVLLATDGLRRVGLLVFFGIAACLVMMPTILLNRGQNPILTGFFATLPYKQIEPDTAVSDLPPPSIFVFSKSTPEATSAPIAQSASFAIPELEIDAQIIELPLQDGSWDVSDLGEQVGLLEGFGEHPGDEYAMVFAGHMTFPSSANLLQGAFADLQYAIYGTVLFLMVDGEPLAYEVIEISRVQPNEVDKLSLPDGDSILMVTCTDWDENGRVYANRLLVRAKRVETVED